MSPAGATAAANHVVQFYDEDGALCESVAGYLLGGLVEGQPIVVIATPEHRARFAELLEREGVDVRRRMALGEITMLDARETMSRFLGHDNAPNAERFEATVGPILDRAMAWNGGGARVRAYGEMVDLLCRDGHIGPALELEMLWNDLARRHSFSLFCAYVLDSFAHDATGALRMVRGAHEHAFEKNEKFVLSDDVRVRLRNIAASRQTKDAESFRMLVESVKDYAIYMLDPRGVVTTWNAGAQRIKGYRPDEIIGHHFSRFYTPEEVAEGAWMRALKAAERDGRFEAEGFRVRKDGSRFWADIVITALRSTAGDLVGFAKVTRDLTERRMAEDMRVQLAKAEEANRVKDEFLALMSHELRTPLTSILGWASMLTPGSDAARLAKGLETIKRNAEMQLRLVDDLLDMSRIASGKLAIDRGPLDLARVVRDALDVVSASAATKGVAISTEGLDHPVPFEGDPARLQQVAWNLLSNAVKFTPSGGAVRLSIATSPASIAITVHDTGVGIEPGFVPHVFERFRQADSSASRKVGGLGLGLSIAKEVVERHGGTIRVHSEGLGRGSTFVVELPRQR